MKKSKGDRDYLFLVPVLVGVGVIVFFAQFVLTQDPVYVPGIDDVSIIPVDGDVYHAHADFRMVLNGTQYDLNSPEYSERDRYMHLHIGNDGGDGLIHMHVRRMSVGHFLSSMGFELDGGCMFLPDGSNICAEGDATFRMFVNGEEVGDFLEYVPSDLDRILVFFGEEPLQKDFDGVTDYSCIFSKKCPEREPEIMAPGESLDL